MHDQHSMIIRPPQGQLVSTCTPDNIVESKARSKKTNIEVSLAHSRSDDSFAHDVSPRLVVCNRGRSLHLADNFACSAQALYHLLALLPSSDGVFAFLEEIIKLCCSVQLLKQISLHFIFGELDQVQHNCFWYHVDHGPSCNVEIRVDE